MDIAKSTKKIKHRIIVRCKSHEKRRLFIILKKENSITLFFYYLYNLKESKHENRLKVVSENRLGDTMDYQPDNKPYSKIFQILYSKATCSFHTYAFALPL